MAALLLHQQKDAPADDFWGLWASSQICALARFPEAPAISFVRECKARTKMLGVEMMYQLGMLDLPHGFPLKWEPTEMAAA